MKKQLKNEKRFVTMPIKFKVKTNQMGIYLELPTDTKKALGLINKPKPEIKFKKIKLRLDEKINTELIRLPQHTLIPYENKNEVLKYKKVNTPKNYIPNELFFCENLGVMTFLPKRKRRRWDRFEVLNMFKFKKDITMLRDGGIRTLKSPYTPQQVRNFLYKD